MTIVSNIQKQNLMKKIILITLFSIISNLVFGQDNMTQYNFYIHKADSLYNIKDYKNSVIQYEKAFNSNDGKAHVVDRYNAACTQALTGNPEKAFYHLFRLAEHPNIKYSNYNHITTDPDLISLHKNKEWKKLIHIIQNNKKEIEKNFDQPLIAILDTIYQEDQKYRIQLQEIEKQYGWESNEVKDHWKIINERDSINLIKVKKILDERGWLGSNIVGDQGNSTLFLVIQHSDLETQEQYLPMMRDAAKKGNADASSLALLEDRVALRKGEKQIYGSQIGRNEETGQYYVFPLIDPDNVDKRRTEVGLGSIQDYVSFFGMTWNVEEYKKNLSETESKQK